MNNYSVVCLHQQYTKPQKLVIFYYYYYYHHHPLLLLLLLLLLLCLREWCSNIDSIQYSMSYQMEGTNSSSNSGRRVS